MFTVSKCLTLHLTKLGSLVFTRRVEPGLSQLTDKPEQAKLMTNINPSCIAQLGWNGRGERTEGRPRLAIGIYF